ncbi:type I restriction-modification system specificity subunit [Rhodococcus gordoniae]|uniref:Type I restriction-modification system specificity subunit n=1 Tax=Rhodococcus gordoniae TaxID=223392 RepID=A0A379M2M7_9NOCA|nr:restriction endonuclease subunit S [Rhodococcus gordoniae]SUE15758.1 type I restriction-modification system specificity subunit [Rhodococcus gordoniae]
MIDLPNGWELKNLNEVVELKRGFDLPARERRGGPYPVLSAGAAAGWHDSGPIKGPGMVVGRATNLGVPTWSDGDFWPLNTTLYAANFYDNHPRFVFHLFENMDLSGFDSGSVQPMLNRNYIAKLKVLVPPFADQRAIAEVLGALDDKIAANRELADVAQALLSARFSALQLDEDYGDQIRLDTYFELNPKCAKPQADEPTYLDMKNLPTSDMLVSDWDQRPAKSGTRFMNGDTLLARITPCLENRKVGYVDFLDDGEVALGSTEYIVFRARPGVPKELAFFLTTSSRFRATAMQHMVGTSGRQRLSAADVAGFTLRKIEDSKLAEWGADAAPLLKHLGSLRDENRTLASLREALLPRLMSGELRVRDRERLVENLI